MNFNLLRDIIKQIRQFYYFRLNLHAQHAVTMYVMTHYRSPPDISYADFTSIFLEKILKARYTLEEMRYFTPKRNKASQAIQSPRTVPFFLLVSLLDGYSFPNVLVKGIVAFKH